MLELQQIRRDINWLIEQVKCLMRKSNLTSPLSATEWSTNHTVELGNPYILGSFVWFGGHVYESLADNNEFPPTNPAYWTDLGEGHLLLEEQADWNATEGRGFIRNKPEVGGATQIEVTHTELLDLINTPSLIKGQVYLLTDYETDWLDPITGEQKYSGVIEPLYLTATDVDKLHNEAKSELYPQDIVYYSIDRNMLNSEYYEYEYGLSKGIIYRRIDTIRNNDIGTDWRHITYRRYAINVTTTYANNTDYYPGNVVELYGEIYICMLPYNSNSGEEFEKYFYKYPYNNGDFVGVGGDGGGSIRCRIRTLDAQIPLDLNSWVDSTIINPVEAFNNTIVDQQLTNTIIENSYDCSGNTITNTFRNNHFSVLKDTTINIDFITNVIKECKGNSIGVYMNNGNIYQNTIKILTGVVINAIFSRNSFQSIRRSDIRDFSANVGNSIFQCKLFSSTDGNIIENFTSVTVLGWFRENIVLRPLGNVDLNSTIFNLDINASNVALANYKFEGPINGADFNMNTVPNLPEDSRITVYRKGIKYYYKYEDEFGDIIIEELF